MFNEKNAIDQGNLATSKTLAVSNAMYLFEYRMLVILLTSCGPLRKQPSHLESRRLVHRRYLYEVLYHFLITITKEYVHFFLKTIGISP